MDYKEKATKSSEMLLEKINKLKNDAVFGILIDIINGFINSDDIGFNSNGTAFVHVSFSDTNEKIENICKSKEVRFFLKKLDIDYKKITGGYGGYGEYIDEYIFCFCTKYKSQLDKIIDELSGISSNETEFSIKPVITPTEAKFLEKLKEFRNRIESLEVKPNDILNELSNLLMALSKTTSISRSSDETKDTYTTEICVDYNIEKEKIKIYINKRFIKILDEAGIDRPYIITKDMITSDIIIGDGKKYTYSFETCDKEKLISSILQKLDKEDPISYDVLNALIQLEATCNKYEYTVTKNLALSHLEKIINGLNNSEDISLRVDDNTNSLYSVIRYSPTISMEDAIIYNSDIFSRFLKKAGISCSKNIFSINTNSQEDLINFIENPDVEVPTLESEMQKLYSVLNQIKEKKDEQNKSEKSINEKERSSRETKILNKNLFGIH